MSQETQTLHEWYMQRLDEAGNDPRSTAEAQGEYVSAVVARSFASMLQHMDEKLEPLTAFIQAIAAFEQRLVKVESRLDALEKQRG